MELTPTEESVICKIYIVRNQRVMMDFDLAAAIPHMTFFETHRHIEHIAFGIFLL